MLLIFSTFSNDFRILKLSLESETFIFKVTIIKYFTIISTLIFRSVKKSYLPFYSSVIYLSVGHSQAVYNLDYNNHSNPKHVVCAYQYNLHREWIHKLMPDFFVAFFQHTSTPEIITHRSRLCLVVHHRRERPTILPTDFCYPLCLFSMLLTRWLQATQTILQKDLWSNTSILRISFTFKVQIW